MLRWPTRENKHERANANEPVGVRENEKKYPCIENFASRKRRRFTTGFDFFFYFLFLFSVRVESELFFDLLDRLRVSSILQEAPREREIEVSSTGTAQEERREGEERRGMERTRFRQLVRDFDTVLVVNLVQLYDHVELKRERKK